MANSSALVEALAQQAVDLDDSQMSGLDTVMALIGGDGDDDDDALLDTVAGAGVLLRQILAADVLPQNWVVSVPAAPPQLALEAHRLMPPAARMLGDSATRSSAAGGAATASAGPPHPPCVLPWIGRQEIHGGLCLPRE